MLQGVEPAIEGAQVGIHSPEPLIDPTFKRLEATVSMSRKVAQPRVGPGLSHRLHDRTVKVSVSHGLHKVNVFSTMAARKPDAYPRTPQLRTSVDPSLRPPLKANPAWASGKTALENPFGAGQLALR